MAERLNVKNNASLQELQGYARQAMERNGEPMDKTDSVLALSVELGKVSKSFRREIGLPSDPKSKFPTKEEALAGLLFFTLHLANISGINLEDAFRQTESKLRRRKNRIKP